MVAFLARAMPLESVFQWTVSRRDRGFDSRIQLRARAQSSRPTADCRKLLRSDGRPNDGGPSWPSAASLQRADSRQFRTFPAESQVKHGCFVLVFGTSPTESQVKHGCFVLVY